MPCVPLVIIYSEIWLPKEDESEFQLFETWGGCKDVSASVSLSATSVLISNHPASPLGIVFRYDDDPPVSFSFFAVTSVLRVGGCLMQVQERGGNG
jgi:hypothetical protein